VDRVTWSGVAASVKWGFRPAGEVRDWTVTRTGAVIELTATVVPGTWNTYAASQRPLVFVAPHQAGSWRWPIEELQNLDGALTARLGPRER